MGKIIEASIEEEVQARVNFKMKEFLTALKNTINRYYVATLKSNSPKYYYYYEALNILEEMVIKEIEMPVPDNEMAITIKRKKRDEAITKLSEKLLKRGTSDYHEKEKIIVNIVDELLDIK